MRLARAGYIPREAVDWDRMELKQPIRDGHVPVESLAERGRPILPPGGLWIRVCKWDAPGLVGDAPSGTA